MANHVLRDPGPPAAAGAWRAQRCAPPSLRSARHGGGLVEAYPPVSLGRADYDHGGTISMFEREGFTVVARPDAPYVVMRRRA